MQRHQLNRQNQIQDSSVSIDCPKINIRSSYRFPKVQLPRSSIDSSRHRKNISINNKNHLIDAIKYSESINKLQINPKFIELITNQYPINKISIISIWGSPKSGKSFLVDSLISNCEETIVRVFSKSQNSGANCSITKTLTNQGTPMIFLDWKGPEGIEIDLESDAFLLMYLISSVVIFNSKHSDSRYEDHLLLSCQKMKSKLVSNQVQHSLPQLLIVKRDSNFNKKESNSFTKSISNMQIFQSNPTVIYLQYPGIESVKQNQIVDAPNVTLNNKFCMGCIQLLELIKTARPRYMNDNVINSNMLVILMVSFAIMINRHHRVVVDSCWQDVLEALAVNGYNSFVTEYSECLQKQFKNQKPVNQYQLFAKLWRVRLQVATKLQNFTNIKGEPIFDRYKQKLKIFVKGKEQMIISINTSKCINIHTTLISQLKKKYFPQNQTVKEQILTKYLNSLQCLPFDAKKSETIYLTIKQLIHNQLGKIGSKSDTTEIKSLIKELQQRAVQLESQLKQRKNEFNSFEYNLKQLKEDLRESLSKIQQKQLQLTDLINQNMRKQQEQKNRMTQQEKEANAKLDQLKVQKKQTIKKQQQEIVMLQDQLKEAESKITTDEQLLRNKLKQKEIGINKIKLKIENQQISRNDKRAQIQRLKRLLSKPEKKKGGCGCFG